MVTDLRNLIVGIQREIRIEPQRWARKRCTDWVISMRADVKIENADAIAIYDHAKVK
jgi:predicted alpha/beta hydrolase family esterase